MLRFSQVVDLIKKADIRSVLELLPFLPEAYRKHYTFLYKSHSLQPASPEFPRVIAYGGDARFIMTFAGDPKVAEHHSVETAELDEPSGEYRFRRILFDPAGKVRPQVDYAPKVCASCHGERPKPIWDAYPFWRGAYGSRSANKFDRINKESVEETFYQRFLSKQRDSGVYAFFPKIGTNADLVKKQKQKGHVVTLTPNGAVADPTAFLSEQLGEIMLRTAAKEIRSHSNYGRFKPALTFIALCEKTIRPKDNIQTSVNGENVEIWQDNPDHIPASQYLSSAYASEFPKFWDTYLKQVNRDHKLRLREALFYNPPGPALSPSGITLDEADFKNFAASRYEYKSTWVYFLGLMGIDPRAWTMSFDHGPLNLEEGGPPAFLRLGYLLFHEDPEVNKYFLVEPMRFYRQATPEVCKQLAINSLDALKLLPADFEPKRPYDLLKSVEAPTANLPLPNGVPTVVRKCLACHSFTAGAPVIPFDRSVDLAAALRMPRPGKPFLFDDILERVASDDMPRKGKLEASEKVELKNYLQSLVSKPN